MPLFLTSTKIKQGGMSFLSTRRFFRAHSLPASVEQKTSSCSICGAAALARPAFVTSQRHHVQSASKQQIGICSVADVQVLRRTTVYIFVLRATVDPKARQRCQSLLTNRHVDCTVGYRLGQQYHRRRKRCGEETYVEAFRSRCCALYLKEECIDLWRKTERR